MSDDPLTPDAATTAQQLAARLDEANQPYAFGGAIALGYWTPPRGTLDVDVEQILRTQGTRLDHAWIRDRLLEIYGARDPRVSQWDDIVREVSEVTT
ncbi:MAG: hypothetical protein ACKV2Q_21665 [Planctomycetaceae bacterium]